MILLFGTRQKRREGLALTENESQEIQYRRLPNIGYSIE